MRADPRALARESELTAAFEALARGFVYPADGPPMELADLDEALLDPAREVMSRSGKGFRARFLEHAWCLAGGEPSELPDVLPLTIELLHAGSLVIDDIEDDSGQRRGRPALHLQYGLPVALNTGNWLYFMALAILSRLDVPADRRAGLYEDANLALMRCHQGQALDLTVRIATRRRLEIPGLVAASTRLKTGSLMRLAATLGARSAGAPTSLVEALGAFGSELGVGLQMLDDWSGVAVDTRREKGVEDVRLQRPTWPWVWLSETADDLAFAEIARQARAVSVEWQAVQVLDRLRGQLGGSAPARIRTQLDSAMAGLRAALPACDRMAALEADVAQLAMAYGGI